MTGSFPEGLKSPWALKADTEGVITSALLCQSRFLHHNPNFQLDLRCGKAGKPGGYTHRFGLTSFLLAVHVNWQRAGYPRSGAMLQKDITVMEMLWEAACHKTMQHNVLALNFLSPWISWRSFNSDENCCKSAKEKHWLAPGCNLFLLCLLMLSAWKYNHLSLYMQLSD